jgi:hypothetical protein
MNCDDDYVNISTAALITNILLTSWGNEMKFTEKIEKELIYSNNQNLKHILNRELN